MDASKAINAIKGTVVVLAGAGMCTGGRIKHHLANNLGRPESTILFVGYQANGTLGRLLLNGVSPVRLFGQPHIVKAKLEQISGFSAHGDRNELLQWLSRVGAPVPRNIFVTHGEPETAHHFAETLRQEKRLSASVPKYGDVAELE